VNKKSHGIPVLDTRNKAVIVVVATYFLLAFQPSASPSDKSERGWVVEEKSAMYGKSIIVQTPKHVKVTSHVDKYVMVATAPKWEMHFYNPANKMYFDGTAKEFQDAVTMQSALGNTLTYNSTPLSWKRTGATTWQNHPVTIWTGTPSGKKPPFDHIEFWTCDDVYMPPPIAKFFNVVLNYPISSGLAIQSVKFKFGGHKQVLLNPNSIKPGQFSASEFNIPSGYQPTKKGTDIFLVTNTNLQDAFADYVGSHH
jgi:hypothetical protein